MTGDSFHHFCYGVSIKSAIDLRPLAPLNKTKNARDLVEVCLSPNDIPRHLKNNETAVSLEYGYYYRKSVAFFEMFDGNRIQVKPETKYFTSDFIRILLNYPFACLMLQRKLFLLHASAVEWNNRTFLFAGPSLSGKSTIASYLITMGAKLLSEDTAVIKLENNEAYIYPSYPMIKISKAANEKIKFSIQDGINFPFDKNGRMGFLLDKNRFCTEKRKIDICIFPEWSENELRFDDLSFNSCLSRLMNASLSIYPLTEEKEVELLRNNALFYKSTKTYSYERQKGFSDLHKFSAILKDL